MIEVYSVAGHSLYAAETISNLTAINVPTNIVIVRINGQEVKVAVR